MLSVGTEIHFAERSFAAKDPLGDPCLECSKTKFGKRHGSLLYSTTREPVFYPLIINFLLPQSVSRVCFYLP